ncbi:hypothetical protein [Flavobacterium aestuarii]|uniref:hypothetical protein n=1 Tax=Flavobacterium aestuarii TaxID=3149227 RepID=UPI0032B315B6
MKQKSGAELAVANGENLNPFYFVNETPAVLISSESKIKPFNIKTTILVDMHTNKGNVISLVSK